MAGDWIKFETTTPDKPEVFEIAEALSIDPDAVVGKCLRVWSWFDQYTENGNAPVTVRALLDRVTGVTGFCNSLEKVGWLVLDGDWLFLPNFDRHNGKTAKNRALTAKRVASSRKTSNKCNAGSVTKNVTSALAKEEKSREEYIPLTPKGGSGSNPVSGKSPLSDLHCRIIRCITPNSKCDRARDSAEMRAWKNNKAKIEAEDVALVEKFYRAPKSKDCDATWQRKNGVTQLLNQWTAQVEAAGSWSSEGSKLTKKGGFTSV